MKTQTRIIAGVAAIALLGDASLAFAQAKPAAGAAAKPPAAAAAKPAATAAAPNAAAAAAGAPAPVNLTATVPGVCILQRDMVLGASTVGKYVQTRLGQLATQVNAELGGEKTAIETAAKDLDAKKTALGQAAYQQQGTALQARANALTDKAQLRDRELQATEQKALQQIWTNAVPLIAEEVKAKNCAVVFDSSAIMLANNAMDVTPGVLKALDAKVTQFPFDREHLDAQPAAQQR